MLYVVYLRSGPDCALCNDEYGYYTGKTYTVRGEKFPITDKKITSNTKRYTSEKRAQNAIDKLVEKCAYVYGNSYVEEVEDDRHKTKYAIYKTSYGGLYAKEYIDNLNKCVNFLGSHLVREDDLPIVLNYVGGRTSFYPQDKNFLEIITIDEDKEPLTREQMYPKNSPNFMYGWIDPDGNTYTCGYECHSWAADAITEELRMDGYSRGERKLEEAGWIKVTRANRSEARNVYVNDLFVTKKQADALFDLGLYESRFVKHMIEHSQDKW